MKMLHKKKINQTQGNIEGIEEQKIKPIETNSKMAEVNSYW